MDYEYLDRNLFLWPRFQPFDEGQSCLAHAQKEFWVILPFHDKGRLPIFISNLFS